MNTAQINTDTETGEDMSDSEWRTVTCHGYNRRPCPTHVYSKYALVQDGQQSTEVKMAKPQAHVMMTQINIKQGIKALGE